MLRIMTIITMSIMTTEPMETKRLISAIGKSKAVLLVVVLVVKPSIVVVVVVVVLVVVVAIEKPVG